MLSVDTPFAALAGRLGTTLVTVPLEDDVALGPARYRDSALYKAIIEYNPDVLVVDLYWFPLDPFIRDLPCKKIILIRQVEPRFFGMALPDRELAFRPGDYDLVLRTEPGFELPFPSLEIDPMIIRNHEEIMDANAARANLGLATGDRACLFAFNGNESEGAKAWKSFSYLEEEGWKVVRSDNRQGGLFQAVVWYNAFDMLVCGAGYSAFWEAQYFNKEACFVPYPRRFEDQARRIALCSDYTPESNGADQLVQIILSL